MDAALLRAVNGFHRGWLDPVARFLGEYGLVLFLITLLIALALKGRRVASDVRDGVLAGLFSEFLAERVLKQIIGRPRPTAVPALRRVLHVVGRVPPASSYSFPSGASTAAFAAATWLWLRWGPRAGIPATVVAVLVAWARMYAGVHYPSDVTAGAVLGVLIAYAVHRFGRWSERSIAMSRA